MTQHAYHREHDVAVDAVRQAVRLCEAVRAGLVLGTIEKEDRSPVTIADYGSQALVCRALREAFPDDPVVAEEDATALREPSHATLRMSIEDHVRGLGYTVQGDDVLQWIDYGGTRAYSSRFWTLDPIDGTKGFLRGEHYAVALALIVEGVLEVAALACPFLENGAGSRGVVFSAVRGGGTYCRPLGGGGGAERVHVSPLLDVTRARFCESVESAHSSHSDAAAVAEYLGIVADPVRLDSQTKYGLLARGDAEIYLRLPTRPGYVEKIWDHAAGTLIVTEAGGTVTDVQGRPLEFHHGRGLRQNRGVVATNGRLHDEVLAALEAVGVSS